MTRGRRTVWRTAWSSGVLTALHVGGSLAIIGVCVYVAVIVAQLTVCTDEGIGCDRVPSWVLRVAK